ncbi:MAG TPA: chromosome segregation protein SMC, partial [Methylovirgula sp.]
REGAQRIRQRISQSEQDIAREQALDTDAEGALGNLSREVSDLETATESAAEDLRAAQERADAFLKALNEAEQTLERLTNELAENNARRQSHQRAREVAMALGETSAQQLAEAKERLETAMAGTASAPDVRAAEQVAEQARHHADEARKAAAHARVALETAEETENLFREPLEIAERNVQRLSAESKALADLLRPQGADLWPPLIDAVRVQPGYEAAFAAALGDDLQAPLDEAAPHHWRDLGAYDESAPLPGDVQPLARFVQGPAALARRLAMTGVIFHDQGAALQKSLKPGQRLVSPRGDLWRWDGYAASADAPSQAAIRLAQRNRLADLEEDVEQAKKSRATAFEEFSSAKTAADDARSRESSAEQSERAAEQALIAAQDEAAKAARAAAERASQLASLEAEIRRLSLAHEAAEESAAQASTSLENLGDGTSLAANIETARGDAINSRATSAEARSAVAGLNRDAEIRLQRLSTIAEERSRWQVRRDAATAQIAELNRRLEQMQEELVALEAVPEAIAGKRGALLDTIANAETARNQASDARVDAERALAEADRAAKHADSLLSSAREERAR